MTFQIHHGDDIPNTFRGWRSKYTTRMTFQIHYEDDVFPRYLRSNIRRHLRSNIRRHLRGVLIGGLSFIARDPRLSNHGDDIPNTLRG
jgi:hypothetical protein